MSFQNDYLIKAVFSNTHFEVLWYKPKPKWKSQNETLKIFNSILTQWHNEQQLWHECQRWGFLRKMALCRSATSEKNLVNICPGTSEKGICQRSARILVLARSRENWLRFFSLDLEKFNLCFSFSSRNMRITISNLDLVSKHENYKTKISISSRKIAPSSIFLMIF